MGLRINEVRTICTHLFVLDGVVLRVGIFSGPEDILLNFRAYTCPYKLFIWSACVCVWVCDCVYGYVIYDTILLGDLPLTNHTVVCTYSSSPLSPNAIQLKDIIGWVSLWVTLIPQPFNQENQATDRQTFRPTDRQTYWLTDWHLLLVRLVLWATKASRARKKIMW